MAFVERVVAFLFPEYEEPRPSESNVAAQEARKAQVDSLRQTIRKRQEELTARVKIHRKVDSISDEIRQTLDSRDLEHGKAKQQ